MATDRSLRLTNLCQQASHRIEIMHHLTSSLANLEVRILKNFVRISAGSTPRPKSARSADHDGCGCACTPS